VENTSAYAHEKDRQDVLSGFRKKFYIPRINNREALYFTGNSLGLQPKSAEVYLNQELEDWRTFGVDGHFEARRPWYAYHEFFSGHLAYIAGAKPSEVVAMGSLTANLHSLMVSFYRPDAHRNIILCEKKAFPSDIYALQSQAALHGFDPWEVIVEVEPAKGSSIIRETAWPWS
jgi:kynureninase